MDGILSGIKILSEMRLGRIIVDPFTQSSINDDGINPASIDLTLGNKVRLFKDTYAGSDLHGGQDGSTFKRIADPYLPCFDVKSPIETIEYTISDRGWVLKPGIGYLMHTAERIRTDYYVPILDGRSSIGRLFIKVHETAGFGDAGFDGQYTLEVTSLYPVRVYAGMRFCQMRFHTISGQHHLYENKGHYTGADASGPVASKIHTNFQ